MKRLVVLAVLALLVVGAVQAIRILPWWALLLGALLLVLGGKLVIGRLVRKLFLMPFRAKGAVLRDAEAHVHRVSPATPTDDEKEAFPGRQQYLVEVTISPQAVDGPFGMWEPGELRLVKPDSVLHPESDEPDEEDTACDITRIQIENEGRWEDDEGMKFSGPQRLRLVIAVQPGHRALKFRYYFEEFGTVRLAQPVGAHAAIR